MPNLRSSESLAALGFCDNFWHWGTPRAVITKEWLKTCFGRNNMDDGFLKLLVAGGLSFRFYCIMLFCTLVFAAGYLNFPDSEIASYFYVGQFILGTVLALALDIRDNFKKDPESRPCCRVIPMEPYFGGSVAGPCLRSFNALAK